MQHAMLDLLREQNRLLAEQNCLLQKTKNVDTSSKNNLDRGGLMTEYDLQLILNSPDISEAITRWNKSCDERAKRKRGE